MLEQIFARDENFQIRRYILPVLGIYLLPWILLYLNLLPIPPRVTGMNRINNTTKSKSTTCSIDITQFDTSDNIVCAGENCNAKKDVTWPGDSYTSDMVYCCQYSRQGKTWVECCDENTYGIQHHTTSNVVFIYIIILSQIVCLVCCPCSPMFKQFRHRIFRTGV